MITARFPELVEKIRPIRDRNGHHTRPEFEVVWVGMWMCAFNGQTWVFVRLSYNRAVPRIAQSQGCRLCRVVCLHVPI